MCPRTLSDRHDQTETDRALWFFSTGPQQTNLNLQTGLRSIGCSAVEKSRFSDRGGCLRAPSPPALTWVKYQFDKRLHAHITSYIIHFATNRYFYHKKNPPKRFTPTLVKDQTISGYSYKDFPLYSSYILH